MLAKVEPAVLRDCRAALPTLRAHARHLGRQLARALLRAKARLLLLWWVGTAATGRGNGVDKRRSTSHLKRALAGAEVRVGG